MNMLKYMEGFNFEDIFRRIIVKLLSNMGVKWCCFVNKMLKLEERFFMFYDVVKFVI